MQIAFYYTTRLYHSVLKPHGWEGIGDRTDRRWPAAGTCTVNFVSLKTFDYLAVVIHRNFFCLSTFSASGTACALE